MVYSDRRALADRSASLGLRHDVNLWILQNAGQAVEAWPLMLNRDSPIFTSYFPEQFSWMSPVQVLPTWIAVYLSLHEFKFDKTLSAACFDALMPDGYKGTVPRNFKDLFVLELEPDNRLTRKARELL